MQSSQFYIDDFLNREKIGDIDDIEARMLYKQRFLKKFAEAFQFLRVANGTKMIEMADALGLTEQQLRRWLDMPTKYRNEDFLTAVALVLELPDWISRLLFKRAGMNLDDENARHVALDHILRVQSCDGIPAANRQLPGETQHGCRTLSLGCVQAVYKWLDGVNLPSLDNMYCLSILLQVPIDTLVCGKKNSKNTRHADICTKRMVSYYKKIRNRSAA